MSHDISPNEAQQRAIVHTDGPLIVIAGPGTGKTATLVKKIEHLIYSEDIPAETIICLTYTKKAAEEIKERLRQKGEKKLPWVGTFHALGYEYLKKLKKIDEIHLISEEKRNEFLKKIRKQFKTYTHISLKELGQKISHYKQNAFFEEKFVEKLKDLLEHYNMLLSEEHLLDFDDLLYQTYQYLLKDDSQKFINNYILIDEFQDTNRLQYEFIKRIATEKTHICIIGDPNQSIFSFQGALTSGFDVFKKDFPKATEIFLSVNYRNPEKLIHISSKIAANKKKLTAHNPHEAFIRLIRTNNEFSEARWILTEIQQRLGGYDLLQANTDREDENVTFSDFAVLYRTHHLSITLEKLFNDSGIPYQKIGSTSIFETKDVKKITTELKFYKESKNNISIIVDEVIKKLQLTSDSLLSFKSFICRFDSQKDSVAQYLKYIDALEAHEYYDSTSNSVRLSTVHAAKGLEFDYVFISGFEDGIIPYIKNEENIAHIEEEKRLLYVALTRAKKGVYIMTNKYRNNEIKKISRFYSLLKDPFLEELEDEIEKKGLVQRKKRLLKKKQMKLF